MGCPDVYPYPGEEQKEIERLEREKRVLEQRIIDRKNEAYLGSVEFWSSLVQLYQSATDKRDGSERTVQEMLTESLKAVKETKSRYMDELWRDRK